MTSDEITTRQAADVLGCDVSTVSRLVASNTLAPSRIIQTNGRTVLHMFDRLNVEALASQRQAEQVS